MFKKFSKKGASPLMLIMFAILIGVAVLVVMNFREVSTTPRTLSIEQQVGGGGASPSGVLSLVEDVTITFSAKDVSDDSINVNGNHQYRICNAGGGCGSLKTVANLGTDTASPRDTLEVLFGQGNSTGFNVYLNNYRTFVVPDKGTFEAIDSLWRNGTTTIEVFNEEGNLIDTVAENETLGAGDAPTLTHKIKGTKDRGQYAHGGCLIVEYNQTAYDDVKVSYDVIGSVRLSTPDWYSESTTSHTTKTYQVPAFKDNMILAGSVTPEVDDNVDPVGIGTGSDILMTLVPNEWRFNGDAKAFELFKCSEDQDGNRLASPIDEQRFTLNVD